jgi:flagellar hook-associated protein 3 FlgL
MTRITHQTIAANALANLQHSLSVTQKLSDRLSSGRLIQRPSDDPAGTVSALQIRADSRAQQQYSRSAADGLGWLGAADGALNTAIVSLRRAQELTLRGANTGANGPDARAAMAVEIQQIRDAMLEAANTTYLGRPVFGGTTDAKKAFEDGASRNDGGKVFRTVGPNTSIRVDTEWPDLPVPGKAEGLSVFALLQRVAVNLTDAPDSLQQDLADLSGVLGEFTSALADVGARYARVESLGQKADATILDLKSALSEIENIDLPKTVMELQLQQVAHQAALGATARVIQPTLMDFLR